MAKRKSETFEDKAVGGPLTVDGGQRMVRVRILPLHAIGGYGRAGDVVEMPEALARAYERDGYVEILTVDRGRQTAEVEDEPDERG